MNRYWKHFFSRGLVDPEDDMRVTNPATNPELLDALAKHFIDSGFDLKDLVRTICTSQVYQLASTPNEYNANDKQNFSRYYPKRLTAEVLLDAIDQVTASKTGVRRRAAGTRAVQLPDNGFNSYFLTVFGRPEVDQRLRVRAFVARPTWRRACTCSTRRKCRASCRPAAAGRRCWPADKNRSREDKIREIYLRVYSRAAAGRRSGRGARAPVQSQGRKAGLRGHSVGLVNTKEFLFNH